MPIDPNNLAATATLTFDDEFNSLSLWNGSTGWYTNYNFNGSDVATFTGNGELQWYVNAANPNTAGVQPWTISNGVLTLTCAPSDPSIQPYIDNYQYTSGMLSSQFSFSQLYGYFEVSAKLPAGQGFWPAFWLLPTNSAFRPEIDVMEVLGQAPTSLWQFSHTADLSFDTAFNNTVPDMSAAFHRYGVDWEPDKITFYFDGQVMGVAPTAPEDNAPMFMILNLALGGVWAGPPDGTTAFPGQYQIDYVRAYQPKDVGVHLAIGPSSLSHSEGDAGATAFTYTVTRSGDLGGASSVSWSVAGATGTPADGADFIGGVLPSGTLDFTAGQATAQITVDVAGDTVVEPNEGFTVSLVNPTGATILTGSASGTIVDDDAPAATTLTLSPPAISQPEGDLGITWYIYTVTRSGDLSGPTTADYAVTGSGANPASASDFDGGVFPANKVWFGGGESVKQIWVPVVGDTTPEPTEQFTLTLSNPTGASITSGVAQGTITNDDGGAVPPSLAIAPASVAHAEGDSGSTAFSYTIARSGDLSGTSSVHWAVTGSGANPAGAADFTGGQLPSGDVSFAAGQNSATVTVDVAGDTALEPDEGFTVSLSNAVGASIGAASATGLIVNDDASPPPAAPTGLDLAAADDTGASSTDNITLNTSGLTITGSGAGGDTVTLYDDANNNATKDAGEATLATATVSGGVFSADIALAEGSHHVRAYQTDAADAASASSSALDIVVDTTSPAPVITAMSLGQGGNGRLKLTGTSEPGSVVSVFDGSARLGQVTAASDGTWSFTTARHPTDSLHAYTASAVDVAGNAGAAANVAALGSSAGDTLSGGSGADRILGGGGGDSLTGGQGNDVFIYVQTTDSRPGAPDTIGDFVHGDDLFDFSAIKGLHNAAVIFDSQAPGAIAGRTIEVVASGTETIVYANASASSESLSAVDMVIHLPGATGLTGSDFLL